MSKNVRWSLLFVSQLSCSVKPKTDGKTIIASFLKQRKNGKPDEHEEMVHRPTPDIDSVNYYIFVFVPFSFRHCDCFSGHLANVELVFYCILVLPSLSLLYALITVCWRTEVKFHGAWFYW